MSTNIINYERLKSFTSFASFTNKQLEYINNYCKLIDFEKSELIININSISQDHFFLLEGVVKLVALDHSYSIIKAHSVEAKETLVKLRPSNYIASAFTPCKIMIISGFAYGKLIHAMNNE